MRGLRILHKSRPLLGDALVAFCLAVTITSLVMAPLPAAARNLAKSSAPVQADPKLWNEPLTEEQSIVQLLNRITFGPRPGDIERVRRVGLKAFLDEQLHPERIEDSAVEAKLAALPTLSLNTEQLLAQFKEPKPAVKPKDTPKASTPATGINPVAANVPAAKPTPPPRATVMNLPGPQRVMSELAREEVWRAVYSNRQLQEVMVQFWMNHFNIFAPKGADRWLLTSFERDTIRPHALGKFEDLLVATAKSPAMLSYLDNWMSSTPYPTVAGPGNRGWGMPAPGILLGRRQRGGLRSVVLGRGPVNNRALRVPPQPVPVGSQRPPNRRGLNENYGRELMELHTLGVDGGYTQKDVVEVARCFTGWTIERPQQRGDFTFNPKMHDFGEKLVLGHKVRAGGGMQDGLKVLHLLARHRSTAHFIALKLCRRFIADEPPEAVVNRASKTFLKSKGDIRQVLKTILTSPEFYSQAAFRAKVKSPLELVASSLRALGGDTDADLPLLQAIARMGQPMFQYEAPTGFPDRAGTWINSGALLTRLNFAMMLAANRLPGTEIHLQEFENSEASPEAIVDQLAQETVGGVLAPETRKAILAKLEANTAAGDAKSEAYVPVIAALLLASPEFQHR